MSDHIAAIHKEAKSDFGVSFPDFPGCVAAGATIDEAKEMAQEALSLHVEGMLQDGDRTPPPLRLADIAADPDYSDALAFFVVTVAEPKTKTARVNITVPESTLHKIDMAARKRGMSRSSFFVHAAQNAMAPR